MDRVLATNLVGEHVFLTASEFAQLAEGQLPPDSPLVRRLRAKHLIRLAGESLPLELLALKTRTRYECLPSFTGLHMLVVTLRCEHSCPYCQVSRRSVDSERYDMSEEVARLSVEMAFKSPSPVIKIEFQGGEPLLNFERIQQVVELAEAMNGHHQKELVFVIATNLALLDDEVIEFADDHGIYFSTSLDGPRDLHNRNRPRPSCDSWERAIAGIRRVQEELGRDRVSALMTTTAASLERATDIVDAYVAAGLRDIFFRPMSAYGFAVKTKSHLAYDTERWLRFYETGLRYILDLNAAGVPMAEQYAAIILKKMLAGGDPGFVDLTSPSGLGIGALVYNYDGDVYASDEGRMLAEMGDKTFRLGNLFHDSYEVIMLSEALCAPLEQSFTLSAPMCSDCAFEPYCGADPVHHHAATGDYVGRKPVSDFCKRNRGIARLLLELYEQDAFARETFMRWASP
jgi:His-Xaa-Ser system radical SAM maturase HxsB